MSEIKKAGGATPLTVPFTSTWASLAGFTVSIEMDPYGWVSINGFAAPNGASTADGQSVMTLPADWRPPQTYQPFWAYSDVATGSVRVGSDGTVKIYGHSGCSWVSLAAIRFKVA